ncbi:LbFV_orf23-like [Cotesia congregata filamentous virus 1]|uniref:LbFV_orf23-like n=1 Tax=Cotesia congregata filamentous virus 1 TaxID=3064291 RepID=A0ABC8QK52_9VIRU|nr:LbFV_orf23-like [Cotesia congregata filamentous virus 1]
MSLNNEHWFTPPKCNNIKILFISIHTFILFLLFLLSLYLLNLQTGYTISMILLVLLTTQAYALYMSYKMPEPIKCAD